MADDLHYVPGSFYRICDRTGFKVRAGRTRQEWNQLIVRDQSWEPRQPQDFVTGVRDDQSVPMARPRSPNVFVYPTGYSTFLVQPNTDAPDGIAVTPTPGDAQAMLVINGQFYVYRGNAVTAESLPGYVT